MTTSDDSAGKPDAAGISLRMRWMLTALLAVLFALGLVQRQTVLLDDAFIFQTFVRNALEGHGLTYAGGAWVEGYSSPLWVLLLLGLGKLGGVGLPAAKALGAVCGVAACALLAWADVPRRSLPLLLTLGVVLALQPPLLWFSTVGMETSLMALLVMAIGVGMINRNLALVAVAAALVAVSRPEGPMYTLLAALWIVGECRARGYGAMRIAGIGLLVAAPAIGWEVYRLCAYHAFLANSAFAKIGRPVMTGWSRHGISYLLDSSGQMASVWILFLSGAALALAAMRNKAVENPRVQAAVFILLMAAGGIGFGIATGGDWMPWARFFVPVIPLMALMPLAMSGLAGPRQRRMLAVAAAIACVAVAFQQRQDYSKGEPHLRASWPDSVEYVLFHPQYAAYAQHYFAYFMLRYTVPGDTVVHFDLGQSIYFANDVGVIDQFGLVSRFESEYLHGLHTPEQAQQHFREVSPSVVFALLRPKDNGNSAFVVGQPFLPVLARDYTVVDSHRWYEDAMLMVFVRNDALQRNADPERLARWEANSHGLFYSRDLMLADVPPVRKR